LVLAGGREEAKDKVALVQAVLKTPTAELLPDLIPEFLAVDPAVLPPKLRRPFAAKRLELYTLKQIADGRKKGGVRMPEADCSIPKEAKGDSIGVLKMAGYEEISDEEEKFVEKETKCTEHDLMCEFSLQIVMERMGKAQETRHYYFLHTRDPLFGVVAQYRQGHSGQTHFFGLGVPVCAPH
jgi:hypothetical protein